MTTPERYTAQLGQMAKNAEEWRKAHPTAEALIQFNFPREVAVIAPISEAVEKKFVVTNDHGLALLKALWSWDDRYEPTVMMCRAAQRMADETLSNAAPATTTQPERPHG